MSQNEITAKVRELKELQALIDQAQAEAETIRDELKKYMDDNGTEELHADVYRVKYTTVRSNRSTARLSERTRRGFTNSTQGR